MVDPEVEAGRIGLAIEKIEIMLAHEKLRVVENVGRLTGRVKFVVHDVQVRIVWTRQLSAGRVAKDEVHYSRSSAAANHFVVDDKYTKRLAAFARIESEFAKRNLAENSRVVHRCYT